MSWHAIAAYHTRSMKSLPNNLVVAIVKFSPFSQQFHHAFAASWHLLENCNNLHTPPLLCLPNTGSLDSWLNMEKVTPTLKAHPKPQHHHEHPSWYWTGYKWTTRLGLQALLPLDFCRTTVNTQKQPKAAVLIACTTITRWWIQMSHEF